MTNVRSPVQCRAPIRMCADSPAPTDSLKQSVMSKTVTLLSAICIGSSAPSPSRARELSPEAFAALSVGDSTSLVAKAAVAEAPAKEGKSLKTYSMAVAAGASGFASVLLLRRGGKKDPSPTNVMEKKLDETKVGTDIVAAGVNVTFCKVGKVVILKRVLWPTILILQQY